MEAKIKCPKCNKLEEIEVKSGGEVDVLNGVDNSLNFFSTKGDGGEVLIKCKECGNTELFSTRSYEERDAEKIGLNKIGEVNSSQKRTPIFNMILSVTLAVFLFSDLGEGFLDDMVGFNNTVKTVSTLLLFTFFIQHEICHFVASKILGYQTKIKLTSITLSGTVKRNDFLMIVLSPLVIMTTIYLLVLSIFPYLASSSIIIILLNYMGASNDIFQFKSIVKCPKDNYIVNGNGKFSIYR